MNVSRLPIGNAPQPKFSGLTFTAIDGAATVTYTPSTVSTAEYSFDGRKWHPADGVGVVLPLGRTVYYRGKISGNQSDNNCARFTITGKVAASGNCNSLIGGDWEKIDTLPYSYVFGSLFKDCSGLVAAPELPAIKLTNACYVSMFNGCSGLTSAPELPATTLGVSCYRFMFIRCRSLTSAPKLPATKLATACYDYMFQSCNKLSSVSVRFIEWPAKMATTLWLLNTAQEGVITKPAELPDQRGDNYFPANWTVINAEL